MDILDDHGIKRSFIPKPLQEKQTITLLEEALIRIKTWMDLNCLKMNTPKMEFIVFRSKQQLKKVEVASINVNGDSIPRSAVIKYLGTWMRPCTLILDNISLRNVMWQ